MNQTAKIIGKLIIHITQKIIPFSTAKFLQNKFIYKPLIKHFEIDEHNIKLFSAVLFEVRTRCNGNCSFCPASRHHDKRKDISMPMDLYKKVINELKALKYSGKIAYHVNSDPLIFPRLPEFVDYASQSLPSAYIQILTNGIALTLKKAEILLIKGINELTINYYNDDFSAELPEGIRNIRDDLLPKFYKSEQIKAGFGTDGGSHIFRFNIRRRKVNATLSNRAGSAPNKQEKSKMPRGFCIQPFTRFSITADGRVSKCCNDFYFSDVMGNVSDQNVMEIWKGEKFNNVRRHLLQNDREAIETCKKCDYYGIGDYHERNVSKLLYFLTT